MAVGLTTLFLCCSLMMNIPAKSSTMVGTIPARMWATAASPGGSPGPDLPVSASGSAVRLRRSFVPLAGDRRP